MDGPIYCLCFPHSLSLLSPGEVLLEYIIVFLLNNSFRVDFSFVCHAILIL
jgi:hypothetical protein